MITSISGSIGSNTPSLRPDQQAPQPLQDGARRGAELQRGTEEPRAGGSIRTGDSGLGTEALRRLIASEEDAALPEAEGELSDAELELVDKLRARDVEVRRHEEAHARVGGQYAGQPSYTYQTGPDGKRYAIGGEVPIDVAPVPDDPEATIDKMRVVKAAALAPAEPSGADRRVAALADAQRLQAQADLSTQQREEALAAFGEISEDRSGDAAFSTVSSGQRDDPQATRFLAGVTAVSAGQSTEAFDRAA